MNARNLHIRRCTTSLRQQHDCSLQPPALQHNRLNAPKKCDNHFPTNDKDRQVTKMILQKGVTKCLTLYKQGKLQRKENLAHCTMSPEAMAAVSMPQAGS
jgi:hypothetical protein